MISIDKMPQSVTQLNPNNMTKDIYNAVMLIACVIVFNNAPLPGKIEPSKYFGSIFNTKYFKYIDVFLERNEIYPHCWKNGIVFIRKKDMEAVSDVYFSCY